MQNILSYPIKPDLFFNPLKQENILYNQSQLFKEKSENRYLPESSIHCITRHLDKSICSIVNFSVEFYCIFVYTYTTKRYNIYDNVKHTLFSFPYLLFFCLFPYLISFDIIKQITYPSSSIFTPTPVLHSKQIRKCKSALLSMTLVSSANNQLR